MKILAALVALGFVTTGCSGGGPTGTATTIVSAAAWTEHRDCGRHFQALNPEGTQRLMVESRAGAEVTGPSRIELPSPSWRAYVQLGEHFGVFGYDEDRSCTDLIDRDDPEPRVDEEWEVVSGTLTVEPQLRLRGRATAELTAEGLVAQKPGGERVAFDPIAVTSDCWGCAAG